MFFLQKMTDSIETTVGSPKAPARYVNILASLALGGLAILSSTVASIGGYYTSLSEFPDITGNVTIPPATAGWGTISLALTAMTQAVIKKPTRRVLGINILIIGIVAAGIGLTATVSATEEYNIDERIQANFHSTIGNYRTNSSSALQINQLQRSLACCGATDYKAYEAIPEFRHGSVPTSCCISPMHGCGEPPLGLKIHQNGCVEDLTKIVTTAFQHCTIVLSFLGASMAGLWFILMIYYSCIMN